MKKDYPPLEQAPGNLKVSRKKANLKEPDIIFDNSTSNIFPDDYEPPDPGALSTYAPKPFQYQVAPEDMGLTPTSMQYAIIKALATELQKFGLRYDAIVSSSDPKIGKTLPFAATALTKVKQADYIVDSEDARQAIKRTFQTRKDGRIKILAADPQTILRMIGKGNSRELILGHEWRHIEEDNFLAKASMLKITKILNDLGKTDTLRPDIAASIITQFGSIDKFKTTLMEFEANVIPVVDELTNKKEVSSVPPEELAILIEKKDPEYLWMKDTLARLPPYEDIQKMEKRISACVSKKEKHEVLPSVELDHGLLERITTLGNRADHSTEFANNFSIAEEYAVDGLGVRNPTTKQDKQEALQGFISFVREASGLDAAINFLESITDKKHPAYALKRFSADDITNYIMSVDGGKDHPPSNVRIARMQFIIDSNGESPNTEQMQELIKSAEPSQEIKQAFELLNAPQSQAHATRNSSRKRER